MAGPDFAWWQKWESVKMTKFEEKFTSGDGCQLPGLGLHHLVLRDVLDRLEQSGYLLFRLEQVVHYENDIG